MKEVEYKTFSLRTHSKHLAGRPAVCHFELTYRCGLHCRYCQSDCYNLSSHISRELDTLGVKKALDAVFQSGVLWLCLTGGDPLSRPDFSDIYAYAKKKGFITTVFTSGLNIDDDIARLFKEQPPFDVELTLNALDEALYEKMAQTRGVFRRAMRGIGLLIREGVPLKIKVQVTKENLREVSKIRRWAGRNKLRFAASPVLHPRFNRDVSVCRWRITPSQLLALYGEKTLRGKSASHKTCLSMNGQDLFTCIVTSGQGFVVDPYGCLYLCEFIRERRFNLASSSVEQALQGWQDYFDQKSDAADHECLGCLWRQDCLWCPGRAYLEKGRLTASIPYYCRLMRMSDHAFKG